ncbi:GspE/PulE family protein [Lacisediminihabitans changchengi]|uniref:Flp pilus assembly complex ATPase component TadA n=1 Tax=Lacisediminihabitans changchengi TaxID=2787634 RepID=A0A934W2Z8_9MICO|nr:ATPase, T2SS/T4P/T4SS family [Lacisediminihabitans changchengi]MBK4348423.1 Flp pilus assembly complex ATPase component TadA [Lacisediminihabitans changchengi]
MSSLAEILIIRGLMPIESLDDLTGDPTTEELAIVGLVDRGVLSDAQVASARAAQAGLPFVELLDFPIDRTAITLVPALLCRRHDLLPITVNGETLTVAMADPGDVFALDDIRAATRMHIAVVVAERQDLRNAMNRFLRADGELDQLTTAIEEESRPSADVVATGTEALEDDAPIVRFVNLLISQAIQDRASDIHIEPAEHDMRVRYRIDGVLHEMQQAPKQIQNGVISRLKIMSDIDISERRKPQDGRLSVVHAGRKVDLRVATLPTVWGEKVVMRILDNSSSSMQLSDLGLLERNAAAYKKSYTKPYGMILVTGPTGSGKSTTLYTTLNTVARPEINVITVEDPVEYRMAGINQVQVNVKAGLTFASALRSILRSDPDVVLLGEIRDHETAQIAIEASLTGHLVLSTLHTNDAPSAITRLTEMEIEPFLVGSALDSVVAQRLARRLCDRCKEPYVAELNDLAAVGFRLNPDFPMPTLHRAIGCSVCSNTGYRGRIAIHEIMTVTEDIERLAVARASSAEIKNVAMREGMLTLRQDGWAKAQMGLTSIEEILRVVA